MSLFDGDGLRELGRMREGAREKERGRDRKLHKERRGRGEGEGEGEEISKLHSTQTMDCRHCTSDRQSAAKTKL